MRSNHSTRRNSRASILTLAVMLCIGKSQWASAQTKPAPEVKPAPSKPAPAVTEKAKPAPPVQPGQPKNPQATPVEPNKPPEGSDLTPLQNKQVLEIAHHLRTGMDAIRADKTTSENQKVMLTHELIGSAHAALKRVLTDKQQKAIQNEP